MTRSTIGRVRWQPPEQPFLHGLESMLPAAHSLVRGQAVLDEVQGPSGFEHAPQLGKRGCEIRDRAHRPSGQRGVEAVVLEWERLSVESSSLHRDARRPQAFLGELPADVGRLDRGNPGDSVGIKRDVEPRAEADLNDIALETPRRPAAAADLRSSCHMLR